MGINKINDCSNEQITLIMDEYNKTLDLLDAYDHKTLICPKGAYYDEYESLEAAAAEILYMLVKEYKYNKRDAAIVFFKFLDLNNALFIEGKKKISDASLVALIVMIDKSKDEERGQIIKLVRNCM